MSSFGERRPVGDEGFDGSVFDAVGGGSLFVALVDGFYAGVSADLLRASCTRRTSPTPGTT